MKHLKLPAILVVALLAGCALFGVPEPQNSTERLAIAYNVHTSVLQGTTDSLNAGDITSADAEQILGLADESRALLDAARIALEGNDVSTGEGKLNLAMALLSELQLYLRALE